MDIVARATYLMHCSEFRLKAHLWFASKEERLRNYLEWFVKEFYPGEDECIHRNVKILVASATWVGPNVKRLAKVLKIPRDEVELISLRLRNNKIWIRDKLVVEWAGDGPTEDFEGQCWMGLLLDAMVAEGLLERTLEDA